MKTTGRKTLRSTSSAPKSARARAAATATEARHAPPSTEEIALRSYELYVARGRLDGHHVEDWLQAEAELLAR
jgi:hypothetical protein